MKRPLVLIGLAVAVIAATVWVFYRPGKAEAGPQLTLSLVSRGDVVDTVQATGTLEAVTTVQVGTQVSGTVKALHADFNSTVRNGQIIAELEPSLFETQVEQARASLVRLQAELDRARVQVEDTRLKRRRALELSAKQLIPASELETAESNARQAEAALKASEAQIVQARASLNQSQVNLGHTIIRAPIDGIVISRNVDVGQTVAASMQAPTLFVLAKDLTRMQVNASIDESDIGRIQPRQHVTFRVDAYPDDTFTGTVSQVRLQPVVQQNVVSYITIIDVPNPELKLKPGMTATVTVEIARADNVLRVANGALRFSPTAEIFATLGQPVPDTALQPRQTVRGTTGEDRTAAAEQNQGTDMRPNQQSDFVEGRRMRERLRRMSPDERQEFRERMRQMSAEERRQMREQLLQQRPDARAGGEEDRLGRGVGDRQTARRFSAVEESLRAVPLKPVWVFANGKLEQVMVRTGISDGSMTAIVDGPLAEGMQVATGIAQPPAAQQSGGSPFFPFDGGRFVVGPGGFRGGSGGSGGGQRRGGQTSPR